MAFQRCSTTPAAFGSGILRLLLLGILFGVATRVVAEDLIPRNAEWHYLKGSNEPAPAAGNAQAWRLPGYNDFVWQRGNTPLFYGEPLTGTELTDMRGLYSSVFLRREFTVANVPEVETLTLNAICDDGFIAWINGVEVARFNMPEGDVARDGAALGALAEPIPFDAFPVPKPAAVLRQGVNVLAVQAFNASIGGSSDFVWDPSLEFTRDLTAPAIERTVPSAGAVVRSLSSVEVLFTEAVNGVDAADLLINNVPAVSVSEIGPGQFVFAFAQPAVGNVAIRFRDGHGIADKSANPHPFSGAAWSVLLDPKATPPGVVLNEFLAFNSHGIRDGDGDRSDWIELLNTSGELVNLEGWSLTDDATLPRKWRFPAVSLKPNGFLLVYASGKNRATNTAPLHTSFKLSREPGGYLGLYDAGAALVSAFAGYPQQLADISFGRAAGATDRVGYFVTPTPGALNTEAGNGFAPPVQFNESSRTYQGTLTLRLTTTDADATVRYTTDGTVPTAASPSALAEIPLTTAVQIRARSFKTGLLPGPIRSETYIPLSNPVATFTSDLPVMIIHDFNKGRPTANTSTFAHIQVFEPGNNGVTTLTNAPALSGRTAISSRGSSTEGYAKVSMKVEFQDELGFARDVPLLGLPKESDWVLYAPNNFEPILIHNPLAYQLSRDIGRYAPRTRFVEVYLVQSGLGPVAQTSYNGIYVLEEKIKLGKDRVDAPTLEAGQNTAPDITGGYLLKIDRADPGDSGFFSGSQSVLYVDPKEPELKLAERAAQRTYINNYLTRFDAALRSANARDPVTGYAAYIAEPSWIDHHLLNVITFNVDSLRLSTYFYKQRDGKLHFGPVWDFDRTLNSTDGRDANPRVWRSEVGDRGTDFFNYPWWGNLFQDPDFYQRYIDRYQELRLTTFSNTNLSDVIDTLANQVRKAQPREQARWGVSPRGGYQGEVNSLKRWLSNRLDFIDTQFVAPAKFAEAGKRVESGHRIALNGPPGILLYYTLDGTDPRLNGTATGEAMSTSAKLYTGPFAIDRSVRVVVRARNPNQNSLTGANNPPLRSIWSGPVAETFVVNPIPLMVTEIHFHPAGDGAGGAYEASDFEFLELLNTSASKLDLTGVQMQGDVSFTFSTTNAVRSLNGGERVLLVRNLAAFAARYPGVTNVAGVFDGNLANGGGRIVLKGALQEPILDFRFNDTWYPEADGGGRSLVLVDEKASPDTLSTAVPWRPSAAIHGSPGKADAGLVQGPRLTATLNGTQLALQSVGQPGAAYRLETTASAVAPDWQPIETAVAGTDGGVRFNIVIQDRERYFRIRKL